ncbi:glutathione S-transferase D7-like [Hylaeus anthracinus]|uniref:glutathione S-transferase D7-like n=1 Tax=Hylaeus anthracinus TaxID=313031 RepID=UPI0023B92901|nr:glutathione S-transferase D7-like [Hylaeus anthracinus]XP_053999753.1 glutathione S-transferase D7-like [Hylaeus anthracinus]
MTKIILYSHDISPPCRSVLLTAHAIGVEVEIREINLLTRDNKKEDFLKINPQHTIPTIDDDGFVLADSHAIACYLIGKYAKDDSLYPKDLQKRALIDQQLHFDCGVHFSAERRLFGETFLGERKTISESRRNELKEAYGFLDKFLEDKNWLVGDSYTVADICSAATASSGLVVVNLNDYPNVKCWLKRCEEELPGYKEFNVSGVSKLHAAFRSKLG